ncbi:LysR family transcriptional regulator [Vibrio ponticus]|uniref:LysR family transcriptional regulator n=1 Tax=Vibrio ponticus TaxID=265668 RepID=A0ABX3FPD6_9VIBR|nr:LysR family transcriptional regulator [Vibrio ponticus]OLQ94323.1 LysR family transcriptional regulator [Vibrio ponticus]
MLNNINLADIRSFVLIAQLGNFTKAANALEVSRSHVSRQISALEKQMGVTLLTRTTRTLRLTQAGQRFFHQCETALQQIDQALVAAVDDTKKVQGLIRVNCVGGYLGEELVAQAIAEFMQLHPQVIVDLDFSSPRIDLIEDQFDVAFRMGELEDAGFIAKRLMDIEMVTLASPSYVQRYGEPQHPRELTNHRTLTGSVTKWSFVSALESNKHYDIHVKGKLTCKNGRALIKACQLGNGLIRVPKVYCENEINRGELVCVMPQWRINSVPFSTIFHKDRYQPKRIRVFVDFISEWFKSLP